MKNSRLSHKVLCLIGALALSACANNILVKQYADDQRYDLAIRLEARGEYQNALTQWHILQLIYSNPIEIKQQIARIESKISDSISVLNKELAEQPQLNEGNKKLIFLKILSLDPNNKPAQLALRELSRVSAVDHAKREQEFAKVQTITNKKAEKKLKQQNIFSNQILELFELNQFEKIVSSTNNYLSTHPENEQALRFQFNALIKLAELQLSVNNYDQAIAFFEQALSINGMNSPETETRLKSLKQKLSNDFYKKGMKLFSSNLSEAIDMFKKSVYYDNENVNAVRKLKQAQKIQSNLQKIKTRAKE